MLTNVQSSSNENQGPSHPIHMAVYHDVPAAAQAVRELQDTGFTAKEISVVCSDEHRERLFADFVEEHPAGTHAVDAVNVTGAATLGLGSAALLTGLLTSSGVAVFALGAMAGVAALGTLVSLMVTRGAEKELADYYDQAVVHGRILVAVETDDPERQRQADAVLQRHGENAASIPRESVTE